MIYSVLHGDLLAALRFNAVGLIALGLLAWAYLAWTYGRMRGRRIVSWQHHRWAAMVTLVVTVVWFIIRNLPLDPFTALRV